MKKIIPIGIGILFIFLIFNLYDVQALSCGDYISADTTMTEDLDCSNYSGSPIIDLNGLDGTFDCAGYRIIGNNTKQNQRLFTSVQTGDYRTNIIKNCNIFNITYMVYWGYNRDLYFINNNISGVYNLIDIILAAQTVWVEGNHVTDTRSSGNFVSINGISPYNATIVNNTMSNYYRFLRLTNSGGVFKIYNNEINTTINTEMISISNLLEVDFNTSLDCSKTNIIGGNCFGGNYWSKYNGTDIDADGIGDTPYLIFSYNGTDYYDYLPLVRNIAPSVAILDPLNNATIIRDTINSSITFTLRINDSNLNLDKCWYNHLNQSGYLTENVLYNCTTGTNTFDATVNYFGSHTLFTYVNDTTGNLGQANITFSVQQTQQQQPSGGGGQKYETPVPFFLREKTPDKTCSVDGDQDGILCDPNEDWISCPEDCSAPNLDNLLCLSGSGCVWREAWFLKLLFAMLLIITLYLLYVDYSNPPRQRKVFG